MLTLLAAPVALGQDGGVRTAQTSEERVRIPARPDAGPRRARARIAPVPPRLEASDAGAPAVQPLQQIEPLDGGVPHGERVHADGGTSFTFDAAVGDAVVVEELPVLDGGPPDAGMPDAGPPDAGAASLPDAGLPPAARAEPTSDENGNIFSAWSEWMWERAERESAARESAERREVDTPPPAPGLGGIDVVLTERIDEWLGFALPDRRISGFGLGVLLGLALFGLWLINRARRPLPERGFVPRLLGAARLALRLAVVLMILMMASRLLPDWLRPAIVLTLAAGALALGFGVIWVLLPDVVGGIVLLTEGRLKRGQWITGEGFAGSVEQVGPRVTLLRAADGALLAIPNRRVVKSPVRASDRPWHEVDVEIQTPSGAPAQRLREAITEAVLCSPYVPPDPGLVLARDPRAPDRWHLRVRLIDGRFAAAFEGQLLERMEESLALSTRADPPA